MAPFQYTHMVAEKRMRIRLNPEFGMNHWATLEEFYQELIKDGQLLWDLDLGGLQFINSLMLGHIVGFNTLLMCRGGKLRLLTPQNSRIADLIILSKLDSIIELVRGEAGTESTVPVNS